MTEDWSVSTLREHFNDVLKEREARYEQRFQSILEGMASHQRENSAAFASIEKRFDGVNNARRSADDISRSMMPRIEAEQRDTALSEKIDAITARMDRMDGRSGGLNAGWGYVLGAVGLLGTIASIVYAITRVAS